MKRPNALLAAVVFFAVCSAAFADYAVQSPPAGTRDPETPLPDEMDVRTKWSNTTFLELAVDGNVVDLNRIPLPADTPIIDERFGAMRRQ